MTKSRIPKTMTIGGYEYQIKYPYIFRQSDQLTGLHEPNTLTVKISNMLRNQKRHWSKIVETLIHEMVHAVDHVYNAGLLQEFEIELLGIYIFQILKENEFDFNKNKQEPNEIKIGPFIYDIKWDFIFEDHDYMPALVDHQALIMYINPLDTNGVPVAYDIRMATLFYLILLAIANQTVLQDGFECNEENTTLVAKSMIVSFANGLYKTIKDNNFVKLTKTNKDFGGN